MEHFAVSLIVFVLEPVVSCRGRVFAYCWQWRDWYIRLSRLYVLGYRLLGILRLRVCRQVGGDRWGPGPSGQLEFWWWLLLLDERGAQERFCFGDGHCLWELRVGVGERVHLLTNGYVLEERRRSVVSGAGRYCVVHWRWRDR